MLHLCDTFSLFSWHTSTDVERLCSSSADGPGEHLAPPTIWIRPHANVLDEENYNHQEKKKKVLIAGPQRRMFLWSTIHELMWRHVNYIKEVTCKTTAVQRQIHLIAGCLKGLKIFKKKKTLPKEF